jgi:nodulation protein E
MNRRVAVSGIGVVSALGIGREAFWKALAAGRPGIREIEGVDLGQLKFSRGAQVAGYDPLWHFEPKTADFLDLFAQFAALAARESIEDAGLSRHDVEGERTAIVTGCCVGGQATEDRGFADLYLEKRGRVHPLTIPRIMANAGASFTAVENGITGPVYTVSTACSSANHAIGQAFRMVRNGEVDIALAGGSEAIFSLGFLKAWEAMRVVAPDTCRPFSRDRKGLILGEGAAMLVIEPLDRARSRGANVYGEIGGFGMSSDAGHITQPAAAGAVLAMKSALRDAGLSPEAIGYINAHGTGTPANDSTETRAIHELFGAHSQRLAVSSTKSMHGHALGAAGALEAAATLLALYRGILPPTANFTEPDPGCDLDAIPNEARHCHVEAALSNSFAFGGLNAVLAFTAPRTA